MPVIVPPDAYAEWLDPRNEATQPLARLFEPCGRSDLQAWPVGRRVNDARNQGPGLIEQVQTADTLALPPHR
jgi:putative SOS response-associated peptidase YedK